MSKICHICQRKPKISISRSHSNIATKKKQDLNLQWTKLPNNKRVLACTKCIKALSKRK